jgi:sigma-B regulation protein RsbU (phosphoserine phosphatase)
VSWAFAALIVISTMSGQSPLLIAAVAAVGLGWPQAAFLLGRRAADQRRAGLRHLDVDGILAGLFIGFTGFSPLPAGSIAVVALGFSLMMAGVRQVLRGAVSAALGMAASVPVVGFHPVYQPGLLTINACLAFFAGAFGSAAYFVNRTTRALVATKAEIRDSNRILADQSRKLELAVAESIEINEVARTVNAALDLDDVLERVLRSLRKVFEFDQAGTLTISDDTGSLMLDRFVGPGATEEIESRLRSGSIPLSATNSIFVRALRSDGPLCIPDITQDSATAMVPSDLAFWELNPMRSIVMCPLEIRDEVIGLLCLGSRSEPCRLDDRELLTIERYVTHVATAIWSARLFREAQRARRLAERELEIGREIQAEFLPERLPDIPGWEVAARLRSARQVSGDFYDAFELGDGRIAFVVADVCDKGVGAALYMALFRSLLRAAADGAHEPDAPFAAGALRTINDYIADNHERSNMFATMFVGAIDPATGALEYANGGHEPPAVVRADGAVDRLEPTGPAVGLMIGSRFDNRRIALEPGDTLIAFSDGVTEARARDGSMYSEKRLLALVGEGAATARRALDRIESDLERHMSGGPRSDDTTLLAVRRAALSDSVALEIEEGVA